MKLSHCGAQGLALRRAVPKHGLVAVLLSFAGLLIAAPASASDLKVMKVGLGEGTVTSTTPGIACGADCDQNYGSAVTVTLTATPAAGSVFVGWRADCAGVGSCSVNMVSSHAVRAEFGLSAAIPALSDLTPEGIQTYLTSNPAVDSAARFVRALPLVFRQNWVMMTRSESLQTGTADMPRILMPNPDATSVFSLGMATHDAYPGSHPSAIEYMQWDAAQKNFRFHEIVLAPVPAKGVFPARARGVSIDDAKCAQRHSTNNVLNRTGTPGTTGVTPGTVKHKNKPNWDAYDSWGGMMPFNRDRIYQGSVEAAAFRKLLNLWTWRADATSRTLIEQLELQPPGVPASHAVTRLDGGLNDGHIKLGFDPATPVTTEPAPTGTGINVTYSFNGLAGSAPGTSVLRSPNFVTLHYAANPTSDEGRGVRLFDTLGGLGGNLNPIRIADELVHHRYATGSVPIDVRALALAITKGCLTIDAATNRVSAPGLSINHAFFEARNGMSINALLTDTQNRVRSLPRRKADIQRLNLDRTSDLYLLSPGPGLIQQYGAATASGTSTSMSRLRQEVFVRSTSGFAPDQTVMGGIYVDRETASNIPRVALFRYLLEPLGVSVDKWSMGVRGRSRTYTFADVFSRYLNTFTSEIEASLASAPIPGVSPGAACPALITAVNSSLSALPPADAEPTFTDIQRIFNKGCIECHGGLAYPPFDRYFDADYLDLSEDETLSMGDRFARSYSYAMGFTSTTPASSLLYTRVADTSETCPYGGMPCGGPPLSKVDIETIRRWIEGERTSSVGDPHLQTVDGTSYDFQSAGEFTLLRDPGMEVQARQSAVESELPLPPDAHTGLSSCMSVNTAVAVRIGKQRITYQPNLEGEPDPRGLQLRVDGKLVKLGSGLNLADGGRLLPTTVEGGLQLELPGGTDIVVTPVWWSHYQLWFLNIDIRHARATEGVMGNIAPRNWLPALPDGAFLGPRPTTISQRYKVLYEKFAEAWRVDDRTSLFDYAPGIDTRNYTIPEWPYASPKTCKLPDWVPPTHIPPVKPGTPDLAKKVCQNVLTPLRRAQCEHDVLATGEPAFAKAYQAADEIQRNALPSAPKLAYPANNQTDLGTQMRFDWGKASDKDDDRLRYQHCVWRTHERLTFDKCKLVPEGALYTSVFDLKQGSAYYWKVIVEDGKGGTVDSETRRFATK